MRVKWYSKGKFTLEETYEEPKIYIVKRAASFFAMQKFKYDGYHYHIGKFDDENKFYTLSNIISPNIPVSFSNIPVNLKVLKELNFTEKINIKLNKIKIINWDNEEISSWNYSELKEIFGEDQIEFY